MTDIVVIGENEERSEGWRKSRRRLLKLLGTDPQRSPSNDCMQGRDKINEKFSRVENRVVTFTHPTNHIIELGKVLSNSDFNLQVLRLVARTLQPNVTTI
ncbi:hypothetical protein Lal_00039370 [Lupinus albus]|nr:hypothetical protein Lal_00039370 [Lupinus albus]